MSYPSDDPSQRGSGLILASSPAAKKAYGISNVSRSRDLPFPYPEDLVIAPPRIQVPGHSKCGSKLFKARLF